ncbi:MAG: succinate dehydrogenase [Chitinophagales bacterium]|nr:MAG: succinate dehydrogenase [Chitinophagales bacterium]
MSESKAFLNTSIGRKVFMSLTGLFLCLFLVEHLSGNLLLLVSRDKFNVYSHFLTHNPLIRVIEVVLFASILGHVVMSVILTARNRMARPVSYAVYRGSANASWTSRNMPFLGIIILIFLIIHLSNFFAKARFGGVESYILQQPVGLFGMVFPAGMEVHDVYSIVIESFKIWWYVAIYVVCMVALSLHLMHGFHSSFQSLGVHSTDPGSWYRKAGLAFAILIPLGFACIPVYIYLFFR